MLRLFWLVIVSTPYIFYYFFKLIYVEQHPEKYDEEARYAIGRNMVSAAMRNSFVQTRAYGIENLPKEGGYIMYPNHQGKFDVLGIVRSHEKPCTFVMDNKRSQLPFANEFIRLLKGARLNRSDMRSQVETILQIAKEVSSGRRYILFPEGGYAFNENHLQEFHAGSFKCALKARCPIVPVLLIDSYKVFASYTLRPLVTQVHFLPPIPYEEYKDMNTTQIAETVKETIRNKMDQLASPKAK